MTKKFAEKIQVVNHGGDIFEGVMDRPPKESIFEWSGRILQMLLSGKRIERSTSEIGMLRRLLNQPRMFKIVARLLMWKWPNDLAKYRETLNFDGNSHLSQVHDYTVRWAEVGGDAYSYSGRRAERYYQILSLSLLEI